MKMTNKIIFKNFSDYWYYARHLSDRQRKVIFNSLPNEQQEIIKGSYEKEQWDDVFTRDAINSILDDIKTRTGYDILDLKFKVLYGKSVYIPAKLWKIVTEQLNQYKSEHTKFILGGIKTIFCKKNEEVLLLLPSDSEEEE